MRLIDADTLAEELKNLSVTVTGIPNTATILRKALKDSVIKLIDEQPTAYDVDKVVEQLKEEGIFVDDYIGHRCVEIMRKGGIE